MVVTTQPLYPREKDPALIVQEAGWAGLEGREKFAPTGIRSLLRYPGTHATTFRLLNLIRTNPHVCVCVCVCVCLRTLRLESLCVRLYLGNTSQS